MSLRDKLNRIENKVRDLKAEQDDSALVPTGVWHADRETGEVIPGSGTVSRVPREQASAYGILLVPEPCRNNEEFAAEIERCERYQETLQNQAEQAEP